MDETEPPAAPGGRIELEDAAAVEDLTCGGPLRAAR
jgi:hypothetical protein